MAKGDETRQAILARAFELANVIGVSGLTIGRLAEATGLSKSGLFAHFGSKEALEVAVVEEAARQFVQEVMVPALGKPRGERILAALDAVSTRNGVKPAEVALAWIAAQPAVGAAIASATSVDQVASLAKGARLHLPPEDVQHLTDSGA